MGQILVTGATGFIGRHVIECLSRNGSDVVGASRKNLVLDSHAGYSHFSIGDIGLPTDWSHGLKGVSTVIHCAGIGRPAKKNIDTVVEELNRVNVEATRDLAMQAVQSKVRRFVFLSSIKVHGEHTFVGYPLNYKSLERPVSPYATSKLKAELVLREVLENSGTELVIVRAPLVYGRGVTGNVNSIVKALRSGLPLPLANIDNKRSLIGVENLADFLMRCSLQPSAAGQIFLVADMKVFSTTKLVESIAEKMQIRPKLFYVPPPILRAFGKMVRREQEILSLLNNLEVNCTKSQRMLGWKPPFDTETGLARWVTNP